MAKYLGKFYSDNYDDNLNKYLNLFPGFVEYSDNVVEPYFLANVIVNYEFGFDPVFKNVKFTFQINNIFNKLYASYAYGKEFFPGSRKKLLFFNKSKFLIKKAIIIGNGEKPSKSVISRLQKNGFTDLICADGGANNLFKLNIIPKLIIGDLDSIKPDVLEYYSSKTKVIKVKDQNSTDIEKCLNKLIKMNYSEVVLLGCTGNRLDHSLGNLSIMYKYAEKIKTHLVHYQSFISIFSNNFSLKTTPGETISFFWT